MSNKKFVDFTKAFESGKLSPELNKELKSVQGILNLTPTVKETNSNNYIASPTNVAVMKYLETTIRKISSMVDQGLSYSNGDYYIFVQFGGKPSVTKTPNGIIKAMNKLASKHGYIANINVGCIFENYQTLLVKRSGVIDTLELVNSDADEVGEKNARILAPFTVVTLIDKKTNNILSSKVTIVRNNEYENAKKKGSSTHIYYPVPMAEKIALKRAGEQMASALGIDDGVELEALNREISDHNSEYDLTRSNNETIENQKDPLEDTEEVNLDDVDNAAES